MTIALKSSNIIPMIWFTGKLKAMRNKYVSSSIFLRDYSAVKQIGDECTELCNDPFMLSSIATALSKSQVITYGWHDGYLLN